MTQAHGTDAHLRLRTDLAEQSVAALQDISDFLLRWEFLPAAVDVRGRIDARAFEVALEQQRRVA